MKIAIPVFGDRISPRFDCAQLVQIFEAEAGPPAHRQELVAGDWAPHERINHLLELGVNTVICGGIDWWSAESLRSAGVAVLAGVTGEVGPALQALSEGQLVDRGEPCVPGSGDVGGGADPGAGGGQGRGPGGGGGRCARGGGRGGRRGGGRGQGRGGGRRWQGPGGS
jgi:predicted Fe-Mo cluster-binding NifX family protein